MKVTIENYRGFEIEFDTDYEKFQCIITDGDEKESKSFSAVKKFIDDYKKTNQTFKPFNVEKKPDYFSSNTDKQLKIIGLRKDNRFIAETENGEKIQISEYNENDFMIYDKNNEIYLNKLKELELKFEEYRENYVSNKKEIIEKMNIVLLKDYKQNLNK